MHPLTTPAADTPPADTDLAEQARPGHGVPSQDPEATGAAIGIVVGGPVGVVVGASLGAVAGALGSAAATTPVNPKD